ncbi:MAG: efflux RND transporter periplasmic adaptor subunit [Bacteroidia bacterium]
MTKTMIVTLFAWTLIACSSEKKSNETKEVFSTTQAIVIDTSYVVEYAADIHSIQNVEIRTKVKGHLENIYVDEGASVKAGQLLFSINKDAFKLQLLKARANLKSAIAQMKIEQLGLESVKKLYEKNIVSKTEYDKAAALLEAANAKLEEAKSEEQVAELHLSYAEIRAPFDGIIDRIPFKKGSMIDEGSLLTTISNNKEVFAYFNVSEKEYLNIRHQKASIDKNKITLLLANNQPHRYKGSIETIDGEFDKNTGNIAFRAKFANPEILLRHGSSGKVQIINELNQAMIIPQKSTFEIQDKYYVYVVDANNTVKAKNIVVKQSLPHLYVIDNNLSTQESIVFEGIQNVKDGDQIKGEFISMKQIISKFNSK